MDAAGREILIVEVEGRRLGVAADAVVGLVRAVAIETIPGASDRIEGVINVRGRVVPVVDLRRWLGLPARSVEPNDHMVIANAGGRTIVLRVDRALELVRIDRDDTPGATEPDFAAVARLTDGLAPILDLEGLVPANITVAIVAGGGRP